MRWSCEGGESDDGGKEKIDFSFLREQIFFFFSGKNLSHFMKKKWRERDTTPFLCVFPFFSFGLVDLTERGCERERERENSFFLFLGFRAEARDETGVFVLCESKKKKQEKEEKKMRSRSRRKEKNHF